MIADSAPPERALPCLILISINILPLWGKEIILFSTNICGDMFISSSRGSLPRRIAGDLVNRKYIT